MKKGCPLHTYRCMYVYTALIKVLNIHNQSKMHKQDTITNKNIQEKYNILQHLDPEELIKYDWKENRSNVRIFKDFAEWF